MPQLASNLEVIAIDLKQGLNAYKYDFLRNLVLFLFSFMMLNGLPKTSSDKSLHLNLKGVLYISSGNNRDCSRVGS